MKALITATVLAIGAATSASAMFSLQSDDALQTFLDRYDISADPASVSDHERVQLSFIDVSSGMTETAIKAEILSIIGETGEAMTMIDSEVNRDLSNFLDRFGFGDVDVGGLSTQQRVQLSFVDATSGMTSSEVRAEISSILKK